MKNLLFVTAMIGLVCSYSQALAGSCSAERSAVQNQSLAIQNLPSASPDAYRLASMNFDLGQLQEKLAVCQLKEALTPHSTAPTPICTQEKTAFDAANKQLADGKADGKTRRELTNVLPQLEIELNICLDEHAAERGAMASSKGPTDTSSQKTSTSVNGESSLGAAPTNPKD